MGSMGPGIFENDAALDILDDVLEIPLGEIEGFLESDEGRVEHIDAIAASVAIHIALVRGCDAAPPSVQTATRLRDKVLRVFDERFDSLRPKPGHKRARRVELVKLLARYRRIAE